MIMLRNRLLLLIASLRILLFLSLTYIKSRFIIGVVVLLLLLHRRRLNLLRLACTTLLSAFLPLDSILLAAFGSRWLLNEGY